MSSRTALIRGLVVLGVGLFASCGGGSNDQLPAPGGASSNTMGFTATGTNPVPTIDRLTQNCAQVGGQAFTLSVVGSDFVSNSVVRWNGSDRPTTFGNSSQLSAQISASDIASPGTVAINVFNPAPGGGSSNLLMLTIATGGIDPRSVVVDPTGKLAYVANAGCPNAFVGSVSMYTINPMTGTLQPLGSVTAGTAPVSLAIDPSGKFTYVANDFSRNISMYDLDPTTGLLTSEGTINAGGRAVSVTVHSSGKFTYVANGCYDTGRDSVSIFAIDPAAGALSSIGTIPTGATGPSACSIGIGITVEPSGRFAYVVGDGCGLDEYPGYISVYTINQTTGELTSVGQPVAAGYCSAPASVDPFSRFAYVPNSDDDAISMYAVGAADGTLTFLGTVPAGSRPISSAVHPSAKFVYVVNRDSNNVSMYKINSNSGILTAIGTVAAGLSPSSIAIHPSGKFAYVTDSGSNDVSMYSIDPASGTLIFIASIGS